MGVRVRAKVGVGVRVSGQVAQQPRGRAARRAESPPVEVGRGPVWLGVGVGVELGLGLGLGSGLWLGSGSGLGLGLARLTGDVGMHAPLRAQQRGAARRRVVGAAPCRVVQAALHHEHGLHERY